jgi:hypothetical protein
MLLLLLSSASSFTSSARVRGTHRAVALVSPYPSPFSLETCFAVTLCSPCLSRALPCPRALPCSRCFDWFALRSAVLAAAACPCPLRPPSPLASLRRHRTCASSSLRVRVRVVSSSSSWLVQDVHLGVDVAVGLQYRQHVGVVIDVRYGIVRRRAGFCCCSFFVCCFASAAAAVVRAFVVSWLGNRGYSTS